ncbi:hypothetical protein Taro_046801 [Colocasia esculenta]|uniref:Diacylglycerol acyltransferase 3 n=1 Tax=Colocasia esculenta TaxID=4460 RepID=A0A843X601_COLES|nr:hypothetical protein [Colocasia esculenta]
MEATAAGAVARRGAFCPADAAPLPRVARAAGCAGSSRVSVRRPGGFADEGHLRYYAPSARCGGREEEKRVVKRRAKLVKELAVFQAAAGGLGVDGATAGERRITLEEAADVLLARLELMRAEEKEMKRRKKEEKKAAMRAAAKQMEGCDDSEGSEDEQEQMERDGKMRDCNGCKDSDHKDMKRKKQEEKAAMKAACKKKMKDCDESESSSSSSESSDSDCEEEVMDMDSLRTVPANAEPVTEEVQMGIPKDEFSLPTTVRRTEEGVMMDVALNCASESTFCAANGVGPSASTSACCSSVKDCVPVMAAAAAAPVERIEVCMGGKCKKSGAMELMQEFERRLGMEGAVVGCKCMGKCREGPNVRVRNVQEGDEGDESMKAVRNPLCLGVGLDDVGTIVAKFFAGEIQEKDMGLLAA